jgi:hypothetical protein
MGFAGSVQTFNISTGSVGFRDRDRNRKEPESPPRHDGVSYFHVYEFDLQRSSEHALLALYMSLKIAMRDSWKSLPIAARMHWARLFSTKAAVFQRAACTS